MFALARVYTPFPVAAKIENLTGSYAIRGSLVLNLIMARWPEGRAVGAYGPRFLGGITDAKCSCG